MGHSNDTLRFSALRPTASSCRHRSRCARRRYRYCLTSCALLYWGTRWLRINKAIRPDKSLLCILKIDTNALQPMQQTREDARIDIVPPERAREVVPQVVEPALHECDAQYLQRADPRVYSRCVIGS